LRGLFILIKGLGLRRYTIVIIPDGKSSTKRFRVSYPLVACLKLFLGFGLVFGGYAVADYVHMRNLRQTYLQALQDDRALKGEARILMTSLDEVRSSLRKVKEYSAKLAEITNLQTQSLTKRTGLSKVASQAGGSSGSSSNQIPAITSSVPENVDIDKLVFKPVFARLDSITMNSQRGVFELQQIISRLSQQKTLLSSIPSLTPVDGWVTSGFGARSSPFTGEPAIHKGLDVAAPIGTPIYAPADGVVVFAGQRSGFGNFVMIAHGYGVVTGYGHNAQNLVSPGQVIHRGDQIATVGQSGRSTGPHLHYEVTVNGQVIDPKKFILNIDNLAIAAH
jgi:murein DD-endopeptidase MepM/ murein hydrolase activator NlpD